MDDEYQYTEGFAGEVDAMALLTKPFMFYPDVTQNSDQSSQKKRKLDDEQSNTTSSSSMMTMMQSMMSEQHAHILSLNKHILAITSAHHAALTEADKKHRDERERLERLSIELRAELKDARDKIRQLQSSAVKEVIDIDALPPEKKQIVQVKKEVVIKSEPPPPVNVYNWQLVKIRSPKCREVYGFSGEQIELLYELLGTLKELHGQSKSKSKVPEEHFFLVMLYFLKHYDTLQEMSDKFDIPKGTIASRLSKNVSSLSSALFQASIEKELSAPRCRRVFRSYFFVIQKPQATNIAQKYYSALYKTHGIYIYCVHDREASGKVLEFYLSTRKQVDREWLGLHMNENDEDEDDGVSNPYEERLKSKFNMAATRYRGALDDLPDVIECLLALTNFDIEYANVVPPVIILQ